MITLIHYRKKREPRGSLCYYIKDKCNAIDGIWCVYQSESIGIICDVYIKGEDIGKTSCVCIKVRDCSITPPGGLSDWGLLPPIARGNANCNH